MRSLTRSSDLTKQAAGDWRRLSIRAEQAYNITQQVCLAAVYPVLSLRP